MVAYSGHFCFGGDLSKPSITIASVDRFYLSFVICLQLDIALLVQNSVAIWHCLSELWQCTQGVTFFVDTVYNTKMFTNQSGRKESEATWTCRTVTPPCNVNLPHLATQHCISLCTYSTMSTKVIDFSVLVWLAYFSSDYSQLTAAPKGLQRKQDSLQAGCPYHCLTDSVKALKGTISSMLLIWNLLHPTMPSSYNSQYFKITWVNRFQNVNPFWILLQQEMLGGSSGAKQN